MNQTLQVRVELEEDLLRRFNIVRKYYCVENATEVIRLLINEKYKELLPKEAAQEEGVPHP